MIDSLPRRFGVAIVPYRHVLQANLRISCWTRRRGARTTKDGSLQNVTVVKSVGSARARRLAGLVVRGTPELQDRLGQGHSYSLLGTRHRDGC